MKIKIQDTENENLIYYIKTNPCSYIEKNNYFILQTMIKKYDGTLTLKEIYLYNTNKKEVESLIEETVLFKNVKIKYHTNENRYIANQYEIQHTNKLYGFFEVNNYIEATLTNFKKVKKGIQLKLEKINENSDYIYVSYITIKTNNLDRIILKTKNMLLKQCKFYNIKNIIDKKGKSHLFINEKDYLLESKKVK